MTRFHTDFWTPMPNAVHRTIRNLPSALPQRMLGRYHRDIPNHLVSAHTLPAAYAQLRISSTRSRIKKYQLFEKWGRQFATRVARQLLKDRPIAFFGYSSAAYEALKIARDHGVFAVLDEIAPTHLEDEIIAEEHKRFADLEPHYAPTPQPFLNRLELEWDIADRIVVNSRWTRNALIQRGVETEKIQVIPLMFRKPTNGGYVKFRDKRKPLRVLWLGTLCLRKGFPYALEAAKQLKGNCATFTFAGPSQIDVKKASWPSNAKYIGQIARIDASTIWRDHDIFILPTLSDGFAITQLEATAHGLPVIVTPNCGEVIENEKSGLIIPTRNAKAISEAIQKFVDEEISLQNASANAIARAKNFEPHNIWPQLEAALSRSELLGNKFLGVPV
ncbi:MAG: glycosyltransferase family 4 protein [Hyphomicrobiaceae bacterium]